MEDITTLRDYLSTVPAGKLGGTKELRQQVMVRLCAAWSNIKYSDVQNTSADKLWRAEKMEWKPPLLSFVLERHGATVNGSTRAALHFWEVNLETSSARIAKESYRQLEQADERLDCKKLATQIATLIQDGIDCKYLIWSEGKKTVTLKMESVIPTTYERTTIGRRKRFRPIMNQLMTDIGWKVLPKGNKMCFTCTDKTLENQVQE